MAKITYIANDVEVLRFSRKPDTSGMIIPPEAYASFAKTIKVTCGKGDDERHAGKASLRREKDTLYADLILTSSMPDTGKALKMMRKLYPAIAFDVQDAHHNTMLRFKITELILTSNPNDDLNIEPLGTRIQMGYTREGLH